ncbi:hypothetical protein [Falsiroseomonas sp.]|uniref:hypothetical protein n=1 Tax=Falsiroseomonas sp. TaxID=2870721 RepID=UPI0035664839
MIPAAGLLLLLALPAAAQEPGWERHVRELAPALRACLADRPGAMVLEAWPMNHGKAGARLLLPGGGEERCVADLGRGVVDSRSPVAPQDTRPDLGLRTFMLERRCVDARRIEDANGRELGWLAYRACG